MGNMASFTYRDNLDQAIEQSGRVVLDLLPYVFDDKNRSTVITLPDGKSKDVLLNHEEEGQIYNEIKEGNYDVSIDTGPSYIMQKETAVNSMMQLVGANPQVFPLIAAAFAFGPFVPVDWVEAVALALQLL